MAQEPGEGTAEAGVRVLGQVRGKTARAPAATGGTATATATTSAAGGATTSATAARGAAASHPAGEAAATTTTGRAAATDPAATGAAETATAAAGRRADAAAARTNAAAAGAAEAAATAAGRGTAIHARATDAYAATTAAAAAARRDAAEAATTNSTSTTATRDVRFSPAGQFPAEELRTPASPDATGAQGAAAATAVLELRRVGDERSAVSGRLHIKYVSGENATKLCELSLIHKNFFLALRPTTTGAVMRSTGNVPGLMSQAEIDAGAREVFANTLRY